jgi:5-methylcytosine-specific restriction endonuclease McrA
LKQEFTPILEEIRRRQSLQKREDTKTRHAAGRRCRLCGDWFLKDALIINISKYCFGCRSISDRIDKLGVAYESVNPYTVFERDGWCSQHCEYVTPEWLRGHGAEGPTLDHILPIAKGGAHSYANTQCLCHECNSKKSAKIELEPRLVGVTDFTPFMVAKVPARIKGESRQQAEPKKCSCGCYETFTPFVDGNADYKMGHWSRVRPPMYTGCACKWPPTHAKRLYVQRLAGNGKCRKRA